MKHKWKPIRTGYASGWPGFQRCTICKTAFCAPCDYLDSAGTAKFIKKQTARNDCLRKKK